MNMAQATLTVDRLWSEFQSLSPSVQGEFIERLVADEALRAELEDTLDLAIVAERADEPSRPWDDVMGEIRGR